MAIMRNNVDPIRFFHWDHGSEWNKRVSSVTHLLIVDGPRDLLETDAWGIHYAGLHMLESMQIAAERGIISLENSGGTL